MFPMTRRHVLRRLVVAGALVAACPAVTTAHQASRTLRLGILVGIRPAFDPVGAPVDRALVQALREKGWVLGQNLVVEFRTANGYPERLPETARQLAASSVDVIVAGPSAPALAARAATRTIPIVMFGVADPVATGLVASLAHPGGNVTGVGVDWADFSAKRVQLLREAVPKLSRVGVLWNATFKSMTLGFQEIERAAPALGVTIQSLRVSGSSDFDAAFAAMARHRPDGVVVLAGPLRGTDGPRIVEFVTRHRLPTIFEREEDVRGGGLLALGLNLPELAGRAAYYVDRIARGATPAELPVEQPLRIQFFVNLKTARALDLTLPQSLLVRADQLVE